jgi:hypothetical protein
MGQAGMESESRHNFTRAVAELIQKHGRLVSTRNELLSTRVSTGTYVELQGVREEASFLRCRHHNGSGHVNL